MHTPGIEVRPLRQINGMAHFNEVFFTDVAIPDACRLGPVNEGWRVANTMLSNERAMIGSGGASAGATSSRSRSELGVTEDPVLRQQLAQSFTRLQLIKWLGWRARSRKDQGLGPEASVLKLAASRRQELDGNLVMALQGAGGMLYDGDAVANGYWQQQFLMQWSSRIGGGTEQIQRNVIGERVLGLPGSPAWARTSRSGSWPGTRRSARSSQWHEASAPARWCGRLCGDGTRGRVWLVEHRRARSRRSGAWPGRREVDRDAHEVPRPSARRAEAAARSEAQFAAALYQELASAKVMSRSRRRASRRCSA